MPVRENTASDKEPKDPGAWDAFISFAGEDRHDVVEPLVRELAKLNIRVWYDDDILKGGDSQRRAIEHGLSHSPVAIVLLSSHFFGKGWPEAELDALLDRQMAGKCVLIPVRHGLTPTQVREHTPLIGGLRSLSTDKGIPKLAEDLAVVIRRNWVRSADEKGSSPPVDSMAGVPLISALTPAQLAEIRFSVIDDLNELTAEFLVQYIERPQEYRPTPEFFKRLLMVTDRIRNLFSTAAFEAFKKVEVMIGPNLGPTGAGRGASVRRGTECGPCTPL